MAPTPAEGRCRPVSIHSTEPSVRRQRQKSSYCERSANAPLSSSIPQAITRPWYPYALRFSKAEVV